MTQNGQDKKRQQLREQYEDAYFQMLIYEIAKMEGEELLEKNERLKNDPDFQVPESITKKCLETIRTEIEKQEKKKRRACLRKFAVRVACVAAVLGAMGVTAYAAFPSFRAATLNLLIQTSKVSTRLIMTDKQPDAMTDRQDEQNVDEQKILFGYVIPDVPEGFELKEEGETAYLSRVEYEDGKGRLIKFSISSDIENAINLDTEDAEVKSIKIHNAEGLMCTKDNTVKIVWNDPQTGHFIVVTGIGVKSEAVLELAEKIVYQAES